MIDAVWSVSRRGRRSTVTCNAAHARFISLQGVSPAAFAMAYSIMPRGRSATNTDDA
jgi:hypothetical protein